MRRAGQALPARRRCGFGLLGGQGDRLLIDAQDRQHKVRRSLGLLVRGGLALRAGIGLELAGVRVIGAGNDDGLTCGGEQRLNQRLFVVGVIEHFLVQRQCFLPVLLGHEGQQPTQFGQKLLFVDNCHLRMSETPDRRWRGRGMNTGSIINIIAVSMPEVKENSWKSPLLSLDKDSGGL